MDSTFTQPPETICGRYVRQTGIGEGGLLGLGGFGSVWAYRDTIENRNVAIKTLPDVLADTTGKWEEVVENFNIVQECSTSRADIATMYSLMPDGFHRYLIMELIDGQNLGQWLQARKPDGSNRRHAEWPEFKPLLRQICGALDFVHGDPYHIVHRDIKPANIMVDVHGNIKLLDFGIAQKIHSSISVTRSRGDGRREYVGSYPYMSPEQFGLVAASKLDGRSDQYSLAILTFEILSGTLPFEVDAFDALLWKDAHCNQSCPDAEHLGAAANTVLKKALAKRREDRYDNCLAFFNALDDAIKQDVLYLTRGGKVAGGGTPEVNGGSIPKKSVSQKLDESVSQKPNEDGKKKKETPNHSVMTLVVVVALLAILIIAAMVYIGSGADFNSLKDRWLSVEEQLESIGLSDSKVMKTMQTRITTCEQAMNDKDFLILRKSTSKAKKDLDKVEECLKKYHEFNQAKTEAQKAFVEVNFKNDWDNYESWAEGAKSFLSEEKYDEAWEKWNNLKTAMENAKERCDILSGENTRFWQKLDERMENLKNNKEIHKSLPEEWEIFENEYSDKTRLNRLGNYIKSIELCKALGGKLDTMELQMSAKENWESVEEAKEKAEKSLAHIEFLSEMNELEKSFEQAQCLYKDDHNYIEASKSFKNLADLYKSFENKAIENRKSLPEHFGKLQNTRNNILENVKDQLFKEKLQKLTDETNTLIKEQDNSTANELSKSIETLQGKWEQLAHEVEEMNSAKKAFIKCQDANKHLKTIGMQQGNKDTSVLIKKWDEAEKWYQDHIRSHEFKEALALCQEWQKKFDDEFKRMEQYWKREATASKTKAEKYIDKMEQSRKNKIWHEEFRQFMKDWEDGKKAFDDNNYYTAYSHYENINKQFPIFEKVMEIRKFAEKCENFDKEQEWEELEKIAGQWLDFEKDSRKAQDYLLKAKKKKIAMKIQGHLLIFREANRKGDLEDMKNALNNWPKVNLEDGDNLREEAYDLYNKQITLKTSLENKKWHTSFEQAQTILDTKDTMEFGKECCLARESLGFCLENMRDEIKNSPQEAKDRIVKEWRQLKDNADTVLNRLNDNASARDVCKEAKNIHAEANQELAKIHQETVEHCHAIIRKEKEYSELTKQLSIEQEFLKSNYERDDDMTKLDNFMNLCQKLHALDNDNIENIIKMSDKLLDMYQDCAFAVACKKAAQTRQEEIDWEKEKEKTTATNKPAPRIIALPDGQTLKLLPVTHPDGYVFWMGECEVTQRQYMAFYKIQKILGIPNNKFDDECLKNNSDEKTWFGVTIKDMKSYINRMEFPSDEPKGETLPCHSICWDDAFAWSELQNQYNRQHASLSIDNQYVLRLPRVSEWQAACTNDNNILNENIKSKQLLSAKTLHANSLGFHGLLGNVYEWSIEALSNEQRTFFAPPQIFSGRSEKKFERVCLGVGSWIGMHDNQTRPFLTGDGGIYELEENIKADGGKTSRYMPRKKTKRNDIGFRVVLGPILPVR